MDPVETMRAHRRFTLVGAGSLRGDPEGAWTTYRHLEDRVAAERARIREEWKNELSLLQTAWEIDPDIGAAEILDRLDDALDRICPAQE